jgi:diguanylate cyclase
VGWATAVLVAVFAGVGTRLGFASAVITALGHLPDPVANAVVAAVVVVPVSVAAFHWLRARRWALAEAELARLSLHDNLTGLANRLALQRQMPLRIRAAHRDNQKVAVLFCDLDRFKQVNDSYGHDVGDRLMRAVAKRLADTAEPSNPLESSAVAYRYGGDEFVVLSHGVSSPSDADRLAKRLVRAFDAPFEVGQDTIRIGVSIGVTLANGRSERPENLIRDADTAMYHAKRMGPGSVKVFDHTMASGLSRATAQSRLSRAIEGNEFGLTFEPVLTVGDGRIVAVRAHLCWHDPETGVVAPEEFLPALEETGLILPLGSWMLAEACRHARRWRELRPDVPVQVVAPVTARQLAQANFRDVVATALSRTGAERSQICLAIHDASLADEITDAWTMLRYVRTLGVAVALDGFGSASSSFANLRRARLDQLWLDRSLAAGLESASEDTVIVRHLIALAHELDIRVVATGIGNAAQLAVLRQIGGDRALGPFLGCSLTAEDIDIVLTRRPDAAGMASADQPVPIADPDHAWATAPPRPPRHTSPMTPEGRLGPPAQVGDEPDSMATAVGSAPPARLSRLRPYQG